MLAAQGIRHFHLGCAREQQLTELQKATPKPRRRGGEGVSQTREDLVLDEVADRSPFDFNSVSAAARDAWTHSCALSVALETTGGSSPSDGCLEAGDG